VEYQKFQKLQTSIEICPMIVLNDERGGESHVDPEGVGLYIQICGASHLSKSMFGEDMAGEKSNGMHVG
jgi:hypothetical protein